MNHRSRLRSRGVMQDSRGADAHIHYGSCRRRRGTGGAPATRLGRDGTVTMALSSGKGTAGAGGIGARHPRVPAYPLYERVTSAPFCCQPVRRSVLRAGPGSG